MTKNNNPFLAEELKSFLHTFKRQPLLIKKASGSWVWDSQGKKYLDFFSGLAVCGVGHNNQRVVKAVRTQADRLLHSSNFFYTDPQSSLAKELTMRWPGSKVFFANSGAEANELAVKLARLWATFIKKPGREIIVFSNSFHGRTLAMTAASGGWAKKNPMFAPFPAGFKTVDFNDIPALTKAVGKNTIAILIEPVQGEGGVNVATKPFMEAVSTLCKKHNLLLIIDEIQSGMGRTGHFFAFESYGIKPDIVTLAKGLAGGLPLSATLAQPRVANLVTPGLPGSTFGGTPVSCAASLEVLKLLNVHALRKIRKTGDRIFVGLLPFTQFPAVKEIRGKGLMLGIELSVPGIPYVNEARKKGLLINCTQEKVLRFLPPYFITEDEIKKALHILMDVFKILRTTR